MNEATTWALHATPRPERDEASLIRAARVDSNAFGELCMRYADQLYRYLRVRTDSDDDAADLSQQVLARAFDAFPRYQDRGTPFAAWLFRIARNAVTDAYRRRRDTVSWDLSPEAVSLTDSTDLEATFIRQEAHARVQALVRDLPPAHQELLLLRFVAGLRLREIAAVVGKSESAIHRQIIRTLHQIREQYDEDE